MTNQTNNDFKLPLQNVIDQLSKDDAYQVFLLDKFINKHPDGTFIAYNKEDQEYNLVFMLVSDKNILMISEKTKYYVFDSKNHPAVTPRTHEFTAIKFPTSEKRGLCDFSQITIPEYENDTFTLLITANAKGLSDFSSLRHTIESDLGREDDRDLPYDGNVKDIIIEILDNHVDRGRSTELCRVKFKDELVMFVAKPGRSDSGISAIMNEKVYRNMIAYLDKLYPVFPFEVKTTKSTDIAFSFTNFSCMTVELDQSS